LHCFLIEWDFFHNRTELLLIDVKPNKVFTAADQLNKLKLIKRLEVEWAKLLAGSYEHENIINMDYISLTKLLIL